MRSIVVSDPTDFHCMNKDNTLIIILQNLFFWVSQKKVSHTGSGASNRQLTLKTNGFSSVRQCERPKGLLC